MQKNIFLHSHIYISVVFCKTDICVMFKKTMLMKTFIFAFAYKFMFSFTQEYFHSH